MYLHFSPWELHCLQKEEFSLPQRVKEKWKIEKLGTTQYLILGVIFYEIISFSISFSPSSSFLIFDGSH